MTMEGILEIPPHFCKFVVATNNLMYIQGTNDTDLYLEKCYYK